VPLVGIDGKSAPRPQLSSQSLSTALNPLAERAAQHKSLVQRLHDFFAARSWSAASSEVVSHFKSALPTSELLVFKRMLQQMATFDLVSQRWTVKDVWR